MSFNQTSDISTLNGSSLKLIHKFTYLGSREGRGSRYTIHWIAQLNLDPYLIALSTKQSGIKYHFLSLWYDSTRDSTQVSRAIGLMSKVFANWKGSIWVVNFVINRFLYRMFISNIFGYEFIYNQFIYFMTRDSGIAFVVSFYLHFLYSCFLIVFCTQLYDIKCSWLI